MTRDIIELARAAGFEQFVYGQAECFLCGKEWGAVWPLGAEALECPQCGSYDTYREVTNE